MNTTTNAPLGAATLVAAIMTGLAATATAQTTTDAPVRPAPRSNGGGSIVEAPTNLRSFRPSEAAGIIDAASINIPAIFEQLGEDAALWYQHVLTLSNPFFEGRGPDSPGGERAAQYLDFHFRLAGLEPAFPREAEALGGAVNAAWSTYRQPFSYNNPRPQVALNEAVMSIGRGEELTLDQDFAVLGVSATAGVTAPITFAGYAIESGPDGYTSFSDDTDLNGRIAMMLRYEPLDDKGFSQWSDTRFSPKAGMAPKLRALAERGAAGIILVNPPGAVDGNEGLESLQRSARFGKRLSIPVVQMSHDAAGRLLEMADPEGRKLMRFRTLADEGEVRTLDLDNRVLVSIEADLEVDSDLATGNIGGVLRGHGELADEWLVIGGHYDHVGYGYTGTRPNNVGRLHPGADDNASGTAGVLLLANRLSRQYAEAGPDANLRSVLFLAFAGEEAGLHGSKHYIANATIPAEDITAMINMDMIGRLRSANVSLGGTGTAEEYPELIDPLLLASGLKVSKSPGGRGPSDHANFFGAGIPVLFVFTGLHDRYHTPEDYGYTVNPAGAIKVLDLVESMAMTLTAHPENLTFISSIGGGGDSDGRRTGSRVRLGVMPAYGAEVETGVMIESVYPDTSAANGGIKGGDVLIGWNGQGIEDGAKLMSLLREAAPGDIVRMEVLREGQSTMLDVTLKGRE